MAQQKGDDKSKLQTQNKKDSADSLNILNTCSFLITALIALGVLAFYLSHIVIAETVLLISALLILVIVVVFVFNLLPSRKETPSASKLGWLRRFLAYPPIKIMSRMGSSVTLKLFGFGLCIYIFSRDINSFPQHPSHSLAHIVVTLLLFNFMLTLTAMQVLIRIGIAIHKDT